MKHLYFVRHGLSVMNQQGVFSGSTDSHLNEEGRDQARRAGQKLSSAKIDCIVVSPMSRTRETAELIAGEIGYPTDKIIVNDLFIERDFGPLEGTAYEPNLLHAEGVETVDSLVARATEGLHYLQSLNADNILVVSHGAIGRALRHAADPNVPFQPSKGFGNAEVVQLQ